MLYTAVIALQFLFTTSSALPSNTKISRQIPDDPTSICPENWQFDLTSFSGPGCPDGAPGFNRTGNGYSSTVPDWGSHDPPGCAVKFAWFTFPYMQGYIDSKTGDKYFAGQKRESTYCDLRIKYREMRGTFAPYPPPKGKEEYRLVMHPNGTTVEAKYGLDEGVRAVWKFNFLPVGDSTRPKVTDELAIEGPVWNETTSATATRLDWSHVDKSTPVWTEPTCGSASLSMRIELELHADKAGARGLVESKKITWNDNWYGPTVGISHSWERC